MFEGFEVDLEYWSDASGIFDSASQDDFDSDAKKLTEREPQNNTHQVLFPVRLRRMLEFCAVHNLNDIVSWDMDGASFRIHEPNAFVRLILPKFFDQTRLKSFQRVSGMVGFVLFLFNTNRSSHSLLLCVLSNLSGTIFAE